MVVSQMIPNVDYIGKRVEVTWSNKVTYREMGMIGKTGTVIKASGSQSFGVRIDGEYNESSADGVFWFSRNELEFCEKEEAKLMQDYKYIAIVNLLEDHNKIDYGFALYDTEFAMMKNNNQDNPTLVVVNANGKDRRVLGIVKNVVSVEEWGKGISAQVVGVVNMDGFNARELERKRLKELAQKKAAIEKELEAEINKRKTTEYYEEMAKKFSDNPRIAELVGELRELGE